jgi:hypothetical protein
MMDVTDEPFPAVLSELRGYLVALPSGPVEDLDTLKTVLAHAWDSLDGSQEQAMESRKLERVEKPRWNPPLLSFDIERHGGTAMGSTRGTIQQWEVNVDTGSASWTNATHRQLEPMAPRLNVGPLVAEVANLIVTGADDPRLRWAPNGQLVTIIIGAVIPDGGPMQTVRGRRQRFREALVAKLAPMGWRSLGPNRFASGDSEVT